MPMPENANMTKEYLCAEENDTLALAERLAALLPEKAFVTLDGELGAGKTVFVRGLAKGLGITDDITSPTFTIVSEHEGERTLYHFDVYRLSDADELYAIGYDDYLRAEAVTVMEWAVLLPDALPKERLAVTVEGEGLLPRHLTVTAYGARYEEVLKQL